MEEAKITQTEEPKTGNQDNSMYKQGRFPSVVDTDDLVFELGKQIVGRINNEKLLESILNKNKSIEDSINKSKKLQVEAQKRVLELESSNKLYEENNRKLDKELVNVRKKIEEVEQNFIKLKEEFKSKVNENEAFKDSLSKVRSDLKIRSLELQNKSEELIKVEQVNKTLKQSNDALNKEVTVLKQDNDALNNEIKNFKKSMNSSKSKPKSKSKSISS